MSISKWQEFAKVGKNYDVHSYTPPTTAPTEHGAHEDISPPSSEWNCLSVSVVPQQKAVNQTYRWLGGEPWGFGGGPFPVQYPAIGTVPYWSIVFPLAFISGLLLLTKPGKVANVQLPSAC